MDNFQLLKLLADLAYKELLLSIEGLAEPLAWARVECQPEEYMHTEGSVLSNVVHVAGCKFLYGSCAYRDMEIRWRDDVARVEAFWPSWEGAKAYLQEAHDYWTASWADETDPERMVMRFDGQYWPSWKIIGTVTQHDNYHAGQIQMLRSTLRPTDTAPYSEADLARKYCSHLPSW